MDKIELTNQQKKIQRNVKDNFNLVKQSNALFYYYFYLLRNREESETVKLKRERNSDQYHLITEIAFHMQSDKV